MKIKSLILAAILAFTSLSAFAEIVNLNKADATAFQHYLKGVGEKKAKDIVAYRKEHKSFKTIEEIMQVRGIGEGIFEKIKMDLSLTKGVVSAPSKKDKKLSQKKTDAKEEADTSASKVEKTAKVTPKKPAKADLKKTAKSS